MLYVLWTELAVKLVGGTILLLFPQTAIKVLGLPRTDTPFWPRLLGAVLLGMAAANFMDASVRLGHGLSLGGSFVINTVSAFTLGAMLAFKQGPPARRGRLILWALVAVLTGLALVELNHL
jgi:hypothetical protein